MIIFNHQKWLGFSGLVTTFLATGLGNQKETPLGCFSALSAEHKPSIQFSDKRYDLRSWSLKIYRWAQGALFIS